MKLRNLLLFSTLFIWTVGFAQNPIFTQRYTADPSALVYNGTVYLYTSHDLDGQSSYLMNDVTCISSTDMKNWTDHGEVFNATTGTTWAKNAWAPCAVERDGKFYLYFGDGNRSIGVAVSDSPTGPFEDAKGSAVITKSLANSDVPWCYDPSVFIDDDGQAYCYFGGGDPKSDPTLYNARVIKLGNDMISTVGDAVTIPASGFFEGAHIHKRTVNGVKKYYFSFFRNLSGIKIDYMVSDNPMTGWGSKYTVLNTLADNMSNNSQAGIFAFLDKSYITYHNRKLAIDRGVTNTRQRSVCVDEVTYKTDYTMNTVVTTSTGPAQIGSVNPYLLNEAETMASQSYLLPGIEVNTCNDNGIGRAVTDIDNGDWIKVAGVDFGTGASSFKARVSSATTGGTIEIRLDSETGTLIGTCAVNPTGGWDNFEDKTCSITEVTAKHDVYFKFTGGNGLLFNFNWWQFSPTIPLEVNNFTSNEIKTTTIYPNPSATGLFTLSKEENWQVYNLIGQKILEGKGDKIDISSFAKGIYNLKTESTGFKLIYQ